MQRARVKEERIVFRSRGGIPMTDANVPMPKVKPAKDEKDNKKAPAK